MDRIKVHIIENDSLNRAVRFTEVPEILNGNLQWENVDTITVTMLPSGGPASRQNLANFVGVRIQICKFVESAGIRRCSWFGGIQNRIAVAIEVNRPTSQPWI